MVTIDRRAPAVREPIAPDGRMRREKGGDFPDARRTLHEGCAGAVVHVSRSAPNAPKEGYASDWEVALPLAGVFRWKVGRSVSMIDPNCVLYIARDQVFSEAHPIKNRGHAAAVFVPAPAVLDALCNGRRPDSTDHFKLAARLAPPRAQMLARQLCCLSDSKGSLAGDELMIAFLEEAFNGGAPKPLRAPRRIAERAKELLHGRPCRPLSLAEAAREIGVTPIYLTQAFKKSEGVPLYKYQMRLRLARALDALPHCDSIINLAFELGFSSHSHFTAAFAAVYQMPPSEFRARARSLQSRA